MQRMEKLWLYGLRRRSGCEFLSIHWIFGNVGCSPFLMGFCAERKVTISFLTEFGRFLARVSGSVSGNVLLRREQYRRADDYDFSALVARACITGKVANCRTVLQRSLRDHKEKLADYQAVKNGVDRMSATLRRLREPLDLDEVRGGRRRCCPCIFLCV